MKKEWPGKQQSQSVSQSVGRSVGQSVSQSVDQAICKSIIQSFNQFLKWIIYQPFLNTLIYLSTPFYDQGSKSDVGVPMKLKYSLKQNLSVDEDLLNEMVGYHGYCSIVKCCANSDFLVFSCNRVKACN